MGKRIDLTGQRFGKLVVDGYSHTEKDGSACWKSICDCGKITIARSSNLKRGNTKSCGCLNKHIDYILSIKKFFSGKQNYYKESECGTYMEGYLLQRHYAKGNVCMSIFEDNETEIEIIEESVESTIKVALLRNPDFIFDKSMYEDIKKHTWHRHGKSISANINKNTVNLNRYILEHFMKINNKKATFISDKYFDYRFTNIKFSDLNIILHKKNARNQTGYRGVKRDGNKYSASINHNKKTLYLGSFDTSKKAAKAYNKKALEIHGKNAYQNDVK